MAFTGCLFLIQVHVSLYSKDFLKQLNIKFIEFLCDSKGGVWSLYNLNDYLCTSIKKEDNVRQNQGITGRA